jgi:hypothetical protein
MDILNFAYFLCMGLIFALSFMLMIVTPKGIQAGDINNKEKESDTKSNSGIILPSRETVQLLLVVVVFITFSLALLLQNWFGVILWGVLIADHLFGYYIRNRTKK